MPGRSSPQLRSERSDVSRALTNACPGSRVIGGPRASVHHHARGFVDDNQVTVFVNNVKRDIFGDGSKRRLSERSQN